MLLSTHANRTALVMAATCCGLVFGLAARPAQSQGAQAPAPDSSVPVISLEEALHRAQANEPSYAAALADMRVAKLDRSIARAGLLPDATYHNQYLYTEPNGTANQAGQTGSQAAPKFIANNAVREYASQGVFNENIGLGQVAELKRADAAAALASAQLEVARRGLVSAVTGLFYGVIAADDRLAIAKQAESEAADFLTLTTQREQQRESAHADVVKAQLQEQQRERDLRMRQWRRRRRGWNWACCCFPIRARLTPCRARTMWRRLHQAGCGTGCRENNPELKSALAALSQSNADVLAARAAYLPILGLNFTYGIDAPQFAVNGPDGSATWATRRA